MERGDRTSLFFCKLSLDCVVLLHKISKREGVGGVLAEGLMRSSNQIGGEAKDMGVSAERIKIFLK